MVVVGEKRLWFPRNVFYRSFKYILITEIRTHRVGVMWIRPAALGNQLINFNSRAVTSSLELDRIGRRNCSCAGSEATRFIVPTIVVRLTPDIHLGSALGEDSWSCSTRHIQTRLDIFKGSGRDYNRRTKIIIQRLGVHNFGFDWTMHFSVIPLPIPPVLLQAYSSS